MGQFIQVNGDYNIKTYEGGTIKLDTGPNVGRVVITGDIVIGGTTTKVEAENLVIKDNVIVVNDGETGDGVTLQYSGLQVDRGTLERVNVLWDELMSPPVTIPPGDLGGWQLVSGTEGFYNYANSRLKLKEILTDSATDAGDLTLIGVGTGVVKVIGTDNYEDQVTHDDDLPNKKYVDDAILNNPTFQILRDNTRVIVADKEVLTGPGSPAYFTATTTYSTFGESAISLLVDGTLVAQFYSNRIEIGNLEIGGGAARNEITPKAGLTNENIIVRTQGTGKLQTNYALQLERIGTSGETPPVGSPYVPVTPAYVSGSTLIYAGSASLGTTGLYFVNDKTTNPATPTANNEGRYQTGELVSKNRALVFSMIF